MKLLKSNRYILLIVLLVGLFFSPFLFQGKLPIPIDALVGLYHPWRDALSDKYPNGYPYKNPLITDPIRQQYPYRKLAIEGLKNGQLPKWNPYSFSGTPLLANIQAETIYPLNILFWFMNFSTAWSVLIMLQPLFAGIFTFLFLRNLKLGQKASYIGAVSFSFSGFMISWLEWNTISYVAVWMPLILLAIDKLIIRFRLRWAVVLMFGIISTILAGYLQTAIYVLGLSSFYLLVRLWKVSLGNIKKLAKRLVPFLITGGSALLLISYQLVLTWRFIVASSRAFDLSDWHRSDWFIPWQHLLQFIAPDFFGNPATGNYWGVWNYGEFVGYIGLISLILAIYAIVARRDKKTLFFGTILFGSMLLGFRTFIGEIPYKLAIYLVSTMQPSRIVVLIDFSLAVLAALGADYFFRNLSANKKNIWLKPIIIVVGFFVLVFSIIWILILLASNLGFDPGLITNLATAKRNLILPTMLLVLFMGYLILNILKNNKKVFIISSALLLIILSFDNLRFARKFTPFSDPNLLFPSTDTLQFLQNNIGNSRLMSTDRRILTTNVSTHYKLQDVSGYDPLYLQNYLELVAAWTRERPDVSIASFNRILTPQKYGVFITDLLGVKYVLSLDDIRDPKMQLVHEEGRTKIYENTKSYPRAFLVEEVVSLGSKEEVINKMFDNQDKLDNIAFTQENIFVKTMPLEDEEVVKIETYEENRIVIQVNTNHERLLVLTDIYYPEWKVFINDKESSIFEVDYALRGVIVPKGESEVEFRI